MKDAHAVAGVRARGSWIRNPVVGGLGQILIKSSISEVEETVSE